MVAESARPALGFVGLGNMGTPMVSNLLAAGFPVFAFDVDEKARDRARTAGATATASATAAAERSDIVILMLPSSAVVDAVIDEIGEHLRAGALVVDMSSSEPMRTRELAARLDARGVRMIDAPVSGGVAGAENGRLTIMVGGDPDDVARAAPVLDALGRTVHAGDVGAGHAIKALNNLLSATHLLITSEAVSVGRRFGLDPQVMIEIFNASSGRSGSTDNKFPRFILPETYDSGFGLRLMLKDMRIALQLADQVGGPGALGRDAVSQWALAAEALDPASDHTRIAAWVENAEGGSAPGLTT